VLSQVFRRGGLDLGHPFLKVGWGSSFPTQAELGWGTHVRGIDASRKAGPKGLLERVLRSAIILSRRRG
jgi:hypothetical protein